MNRRGRPFKKENSIARKTRINEVMQELKDGRTSRADLAAKYNISVSQIDKDVQEAMRLIEASMLESTEKYRALQFARHEEYYEAITAEFQAARDAAAPASVITLLANTGIKILDQENKMFGLYTQKFEMEQKVTHNFVLPVDQAADMLALIESQGLLSAPSVEGEYREVPAEEVVTDVPSEATVTG